MRRWLYYHLLTLLDLLRLWPSVQQQVIIVAGICLPILMLLGLKNGHVAELRKELLTSPTGREVVFWSAQHGELLRPSTIDSFGDNLGGVDLIIPELHRVVSITAKDANGRRKTIENVTLYSTRRGDPILAQYRADVLTDDEHSLVLAEEVTKSLGVGKGDIVTATVQRMYEGAVERATIDLKVKQAVPLGSEIGYADINLLTAMEQYVQGFQVRRFGWPAFAAAAADEYAGYLILCENTSLLTDEDLRTLRDRGYVVEQVQDKELAGLYGLLISEAADKLTVYRLAARGGGRDQWQRLRIAPSEIARLTEADDVVVPWGDPKILTLNGAKHRVVGFSVPDRTWLNLYLRASSSAHRYDTDTFSVLLPFVESSTSSKASLEYAKDAAISLQVVIPKNETQPKDKPTATPENAPSKKPSPAAVVEPDATQPAEVKPSTKQSSEKPLEATPKPATAPDNMPPDELTKSAKVEPSARQPLVETASDPKGKPEVTTKSGAFEQPAPAVKVEASEKQPPVTKLAEAISKALEAGDDNASEKPGKSVDTASIAKQPAVEKPAEATSKPTPAIPATPAKAEASAKQPSVEKATDPNIKSAVTAKSSDPEKPAPAVKAELGARPPSAETPAEAKAKPLVAPSALPPEKPPASAATESGATQPIAEKSGEQQAKPAATAATSTPEKPSAPAKAEPSPKQPLAKEPAGLPIAVVPVDLLAYLHAFDAGRVEYDPARRLFVPTPREPTFERARLYATTIDDVPAVVDKLKERQFAVMSQSTRISEIHQQDFSLQLLVLIVGAGVFLFGVVTVVTVLLDSTERKRGTIGILRVMGVPRTAVFYMVFLRAAVIGSLAAGLTLGLGYLAGYVLGWEPSPDTTWASWKPIIKVIMKPEDTILVVAGALACCGLGSLIPAFRASRLDPFDAIVEGRFR